MYAEMESCPDFVQDGALDMGIGIEDGEDGEAEITKDLASRPIRKAKRQLGKRSPGKEIGLDGALVQIKKLPLMKNSRKSRNGRGRGLPKKGKYKVITRWTVETFFFFFSRPDKEHNCHSFFHERASPIKVIQFLTCALG